ncbi:MAG: hypothetical protein M3N98_03610 [Actinomycetota bacterium]|nr:hypothetical protein [Actinomycetota bacterium]
MLTLVIATNFIVDQYTRGVIRNAVDEAARAGAQQGAAANACQARANQVLTNLLNGPLGKNVTISCATNGTASTADATATLPGWLPIVPAWTFTVHGRSHLEQNP